jgi:hypothetical protein
MPGPHVRLHLIGVPPGHDDEASPHLRPRRRALEMGTVTHRPFWRIGGSDQRARSTNSAQVMNSQLVNKLRLNLWHHEIARLHTNRRQT